MERSLRNIFQILAIFLIFCKYVATTPTWHTANDGRVYLIESDLNYNWLQANYECARRDMQLAIIGSAAKNQAFDGLLRKIFEKTPNLWLGYHDAFNVTKDTNRPFFAISSGQKMSFSNWKFDEPNNLNNKEHCVHVYKESDYKWNDQSCNTKMGYICEKHYLSIKPAVDLKDKRQAANLFNTNLLKDYENKTQEINQILEATRTSTDTILEGLGKSAKEIFTNSKKSIDEIAISKPYLEAVVADVGESIGEIIREALTEMSGLSQETRQTVELVHLDAEDSINGIAADFKNELENNKNSVDKLFV